ncbi:MAG: hypothetical protein HW387_26 [Parachlamydiales bacterium]|nr:hypothetical protein [Parachlamydiales bacterium]
MKSASISPTFLKRIDEFLILSYPHLRHEDELYYLGEFTPRALACHSPTNQLIRNYKKEISRKDLTDWHYKDEAIQKAANLFHLSIFHTPEIYIRMKNALLVPIPPSEVRSSAKYDDRNLKLLQHLSPQGNIFELLLQKESRPSLRVSKIRVPLALEDNYYLSTNNLSLAIQEIWLFDDVLTQGTTFRAASNTIQKNFPNLKIVGFFIARSVYPS